MTLGSEIFEMYYREMIEKMDQGYRIVIRSPSAPQIVHAISRSSRLDPESNISFFTLPEGVDIGGEEMTERIFSRKELDRGSRRNETFRLFGGHTTISWERKPAEKLRDVVQELLDHPKFIGGEPEVYRGNLTYFCTFCGRMRHDGQPMELKNHKNECVVNKAARTCRS